MQIILIYIYSLMKILVILHFMLCWNIQNNLNRIIRMNRKEVQHDLFLSGNSLPKSRKWC
jgi:hypothetical protein